MTSGAQCSSWALSSHPLQSATAAASDNGRSAATVEALVGSGSAAVNAFTARAMDQDVLPVLLTLRAVHPGVGVSFFAWPGVEFTADGARWTSICWCRTGRGSGATR
jgi:hypothetical protein